MSKTITIITTTAMIIHIKTLPLSSSLSFRSMLLPCTILTLLVVGVLVVVVIGVLVDVVVVVVMGVVVGIVFYAVHPSCICYVY
jgi:hypothetical protein